MINYDYIYKKNVNIKDFCTFKIGGRVRHLFIVYSTQALLNVCFYCKIHKIKYKIIGLASNLLFPEKYNGAIIINRSHSFIFRKNSLYIDSGTTLASAINMCLNRGLGGLENLSAIPSTIGGAVVNNTGAFSCEIKDIIDYVEVYDRQTFKKKRLYNADCKFAYRNSIFKSKDYIITRVKLNLIPMEKILIKEKIVSIINKKIFTQPMNYPSAGSVFKRGKYIPAKLIDDLGLKGIRYNDAQISTKHAGFIVNLGNACKNDVVHLINLINNIVYKIYKTKFELEIELVK